MEVFTEIQAVIFDCDGVLVDSEQMSCGALNVVFESVFGVDIGIDYSPVVGTSLESSLQYYLDKFDLKYDNIEDLATMKEEAYINMAKDSLLSFPNCVEFIQLLLQHNKRIAVASSGSHSKIKFSLTTVGLEKYFHIITSTTEVSHGKPAPDIFLLTAEKLQIRPSNCLVIEDSISGIQAAQAAGMRVVAFPGSFPNDQLIQTGAHLAETGYKWLTYQFNNSLKTNS
ncbi:MAG: HAD family hydrolase [Candidatus Kariarchaeaceae archaeon]|jgi:HAD superfamily hydrolase (TIGR01509 family)